MKRQPVTPRPDWQAQIYNADTPTACLEASVAQWQWLEAMQPRLGSAIDQFNSIHEKLIERWRAYRVACDLPEGASLNFAARWRTACRCSTC